MNYDVNFTELSYKTLAALTRYMESFLGQEEAIRLGHQLLDFAINKPSVIRFCKQVIEQDFGNLAFMCFARITDLNEEVIQWMSKANFCKLNIGVESFSQRVLNEVGKRCDVKEI